MFYHLMKREQAEYNLKMGDFNTGARKEVAGETAVANQGIVLRTISGKKLLTH